MAFDSTPCGGVEHRSERPPDVVREVNDDLVDLLGRELAVLQGAVELKLSEFLLPKRGDDPRYKEPALSDREAFAHPDVAEQMVDSDLLVRIAGIRDPNVVGVGGAEVLQSALPPGVSRVVARAQSEGRRGLTRKRTQRLQALPRGRSADEGIRRRGSPCAHTGAGHR